MKPTIKITLTLLLFLITIIPFTLAVDNPAPIPTDPYASIKNHITAENIRTRTEFTQYTDRKIDEFTTYINTQGQKYVDENFKVLDDRMRAMFLKAQIQLTLNIILSIITAQAIWWFLKRKLEKIRRPRPTSIKDNLSANKYGTISPEYQNKIDAEDKTIIKPTTYQDNNETTPNTPKVDLIEQMLADKRRKEQEQAQREFEKQEKIRQQKMTELNKLKQERLKKTEKITKKINELHLELNPMPPPPMPPPILNTLKE
jgi:hypothetical protein